MLLRKINAGVSLITTALVLAHAIFLAAWMLSRGVVPKSENVLPWILTGAMVLHALLSISFMFLGHRGNQKRKGKSYPKLNAPTILQRISGMLLLVFTALHVAGAAGYMEPPQLVHAIVPPLFFTLVMVHVVVSASKAFITLGIGNAVFVKTVNKAIKGICAVTLVADIIGFYLHVC